MKKWSKKQTGALMLSVLMVFSVLFSACGSKEQTQFEKDSTTQAAVPAQEVTIKCGEAYDIGQTDLSKTTVTIKDESIVYLSGERFLYGATEGNTEVVLDTEGNKTAYNVTVTAGEEGVRKIKGAEPVLDTTAYIGSGYNALASNGTVMTDADLITLNRIFDGDDIQEGINNGSWTLSYYQPQKPMYSDFRETSVSAYEESYKQKIGAELNLDVKGGKIGAGAKVDLDTSTEKDENKESVYSMIYAYKCVSAYGIGGKSSTVNKFIRTVNPDLIADLKNPDITPKEIFEKYGTHIVMGANLGGFLQVSYTMTRTKSTDNKSDLMDIAGKFNIECGKALDIDATGKYQKVTSSSLLKENVTIVNKVKAIGGIGAEKIRQIDDLNDNYSSWITSINADKEDTLGYIGSKSSDLKEIWTLLDPSSTDATEKARYTELRNYYTAEMNKATAK